MAVRMLDLGIRMFLIPQEAFLPQQVAILHGCLWWSHLSWCQQAGHWKSAHGKVCSGLDMHLRSEKIIIDNQLGEDLGHMFFCTRLLNCLSGKSERWGNREGFFNLSPLPIPVYFYFKNGNEFWWTLYPGDESTWLEICTIMCAHLWSALLGQHLRKPQKPCSKH